MNCTTPENELRHARRLLIKAREILKKYQQTTLIPETTNDVQNAINNIALIIPV